MAATKLQTINLPLYFRASSPTNLPISSAAIGSGIGNGFLPSSSIKFSSSITVDIIRNRDGGGALCFARRDVDGSGEWPATVGETDSSSETQNRPVPISAPSITNSTPSSSSSASSFSRGLVFDVGPREDSWDRHGIGSPVVKRFLSDEEERWHMWYHGRPAAAGLDSVGLAVSSNGVHWERVQGPVMRCGNDWWAFDTGGVMPSEVLTMSNARLRASSDAVYWLYYTGVTTSAQEDRDKAMFLPGLAISRDGRHWARIEGEHHSGALFDVGEDGEWDSLFIAGPHVVYHSSSDLRMYYHSYDAECGCFCIGIARSRDGIRWVKLGKIMGGGPPASFDEAGVMNGHVVRNRVGGYWMAYEGLAADGRSSIGLAHSPDGLKDWRRCRDGPVLEPGDGEDDSWDSQGVGSPCLVWMDAEEGWRIYYRGIGKEGRTGIGLAASVSSQRGSYGDGDGDGNSDGKVPRSFRRWTGFLPSLHS